MKNSKQKIMNIIMIAVICVVTLVFLMVGIPQIEEMSMNRERYYNRSGVVSELQDIIGIQKFTLYKDLVNQKEKEKKNYSDLFINGSALTKEQKEYVVTQVNEWFTQKENYFNYNVKNIDYYVLNQAETSYTITNNETFKKRCESIRTEQDDPSSLEVSVDEQNKIKEDYCVYFMLSVGDDGNQLVNYYQGEFEEESFNELDNGLSDLVDTLLYMETDEDEIHNLDWSLVLPKNVTYFFGVKKDFPENDILSNSFYQAKKDVCRTAYVLVLGVITAALALLASILPFRYAKNATGIRHILAVPIELLVCAGSFILILCFELAYEGFGAIYSGELAKDLAGIVFTEGFWNVALSIGVFSFLVLFFACVMAFITWLKTLYHEGVIRYLKERSIIVKTLVWGKNQCSNYVDVTIGEMLSHSCGKKLILIAIAHVIITIALCCIWIFGAFLSVIYNLAVFYYIAMKWKGIKENYNEIISATKSMAEGNLDSQIGENVGPFQELKEEMEQIQVGFKKAVEEEVKSQNMKTELITNVSHDLKTPLTTIITYVDLLKSEEVSSEQREEFISVIDRKANRLKVLIEDLFEMSKATSGNIKLDKIDLDIGCLIKQVCLENDEKMKENGLILRTEIEDKLMVHLDSQKTYRIIENLVCNITKYAMKNSRVYISGALKQNQVELTFKNISEAELDYNGEELVERFVRGDKSRNTEGSGLGLGIAKTLAELQNGTFHVFVDGDLFKVVVLFPAVVK